MKKQAMSELLNQELQGFIEKIRTLQTETNVWEAYLKLTGAADFLYKAKQIEFEEYIRVIESAEAAMKFRVSEIVQRKAS